MNGCREFLDKYNWNKALFKKEDVFKFLDVILDEYNLSSFILKRESFYEEKTLGMYNPNLKTIFINVDEIRRSYLSLLCEIEEEDKYYFYPLAYNTHVYHVLVHEVNHVRQHFNHIHMKDNDLKKVIDEGMEMGFRSPNNLTIREKLIYRLFYFSVLTERNAEVEALKTVIDYLEHTEYKSKVLINYYKKIYRDFLKTGYENGSCPLYKYYLMKNKLKECKNYNFDDIDYQTKLSWGLPLKTLSRK